MKSTASLAAALCGFALLNAGVAQAQLEIASWGGVYQSSQQIGFVTPYNSTVAKAQDRLRLVGHDGTLSELLNGDPPWYLIDLEAPEIEAGCENGLLEPIDARRLNRTLDLLPNMTLECGVANSAWSQLIAVNKSGFSSLGVPLTLGDFFATDLFPGRRALPRRPEGLLEMALLSIGSDPAKIYEQLSGDSGVERALSRLNELGGAILWFETANEGLAFLRDNRAGAALIYHSQILPLARSNPDRYSMVFDGQLIERGYWAIPASTPRRRTSQELLRAALTDEVLARKSQVNNYAPTTEGAFELLDPEMAKLLPTHPDNAEGSFNLDAAWWDGDAGRRARAAFRTWFEEVN